MNTGPMRIFIDVDGTICDMKKDSDIEFLDLPINYEGVNPYPERIKKINKAYLFWCTYYLLDRKGM